MTDIQDRIPNTLHQAVPAMEIVTVDAHTDTRGSIVKNYVLKLGVPPTFDGNERTLSAMGGGWTIVTTVDDGGCVASGRTEFDEDPMLATITTQGAGIAATTDRRVVGSIFDVPSLGLHPDGNQVLLWEVRYSDITSVAISRRKKGSGYQETGLVIQVANGGAFGAVAVNTLDELKQPNFRPQKVRDIAAFIAPFVDAIFVDRAGGTDDPDYLRQLQAARSLRWEPDPDDGVDLIVAIPEPPKHEDRQVPEASGMDPEASDVGSSSRPDVEGSLPIAGWYDDPGGDDAWRYWNGQHWSDSFAMKPTPGDVTA